MSTLLCWAKGIVDTEHLPAELAYLRKIFAYNGVSKKDIDWAIASHDRQKVTPSEEKVIKGLVVIPYYSTVTNRLSPLLWRKGIKTLSPIRQILWPVQDPLGLQVPGV